MADLPFPRCRPRRPIRRGLFFSRCRGGGHILLVMAEPRRYTVLTEQWKATQRELRERMLVKPLRPLPRFVAGADAAFSADKCRVFAAAVVYDREEQRVIEVAPAAGDRDVPYVRRFLTFRGAPTLR